MQWNKKLKQQLYDAEKLIQMLDSFIFTARINNSKSEAINFAKKEVDAYKAKWRN